MLKVFYANMARADEATSIAMDIEDASLEALSGTAARARRLSIKLLSKAMREIYPALPRPLRVERSEHGKPFFRDFPEIYFNLSHSDNHLVCAISDAPVGIDIEAHRERSLAIATRFFHSQEVEFLKILPENEQIQAFYEFWVLKEAYIKATGDGLHMPLSSFCVSLLAKPSLRLPADSGWQLHLIPFAAQPAVTLGLCARAAQAPENGGVFVL